MAEALAGPLRRALAEELAAHAGWGSKGSSAVGGVHAAKSSSSAGSSAGSSPHAISQPELRQRRRDARLAGLPPPMVPGNYESPSMMCAMQEEFKHVAVRHSPGFRYLPERPKKRTFIEQKWGWTAQRPGDWLELRVDTRGHPNSIAPTGNSPPQSTVSLVYLRSYQHMGTARIECVSGCRCSPVELDSTWTRTAKLMERLTMQVTQHRHCRLRVTLLDEPGVAPSDGHKVKLMAIMVTSFPIRLGLASGFEQAA
ncbi:hypothetical protein C2E20_7769 [Micractinium conductrix]|uniref:Uncharacterized protein n=1 Tax=Micractinium conductrix TaxID=554055 RepID=A0A2P6V3Q2_9CHLO|nr:hypothetical protein C2E20_7769 [Micractinium conductrix]|eukprot:PSC68705.1 hypothetical protein C2E20_7769 [Micractinium conductrix]